jgi:hypothetical protein
VPESALVVPLVHRSKVFPAVLVVTLVIRAESPLPPNPGMFAALPEAIGPTVTVCDGLASPHVVLPLYLSMMTVMFATPSVAGR